MNPVSKPTRGEKGPQLALSKGHDIIYVQIYIIKELICNCIHHILYFMSNAKKKKNYISTNPGFTFKKKIKWVTLLKNIDL